jgi:hypothetical protein
MSANRLQALLVAATCACVSLAAVGAQTSPKAPAKSPAKAVTATEPWAKVPAFTTLCYQSTGSTHDPFYARLEAAESAIQADMDKQSAINAKIEEDFRGIDPMEMASRMQQWMMSNPQEAAKYMQAAQAQTAEIQTDLDSAEQRQKSRDASFDAFAKGFEDARIQAYAPIEGRRKALAAKLGHPYRANREDLAAGHVNFYADPSTPRADWVEGESIKAAFDQAYKSICPQWWGANGKAQAYLKQQKAWFTSERIPELERIDAPKLQQYAIMSTPAASYRSTAAYKAVDEYIDVVRKVYNVRDVTARCPQPRDCDGAYP